MNTRIAAGVAALTEKEKQTLRLIVRGHDAKSIARRLDLSVHTINERLRDARRKLAVSSSRAAARALLEDEGDTPESFGDMRIGDAGASRDGPSVALPENGGGRQRLVLVLAGVMLMSLVLAVAALLSQPAATVPAAVTEVPATPVADAEVERAARRFLELIDQGKWNESYALTAASFQRLNSAQVWADMSNRVRPPLGAVVSRTFLSHEEVPTPPAGYEIVKFRTSFANKADAIETVSLERVGGGWRVAGVYVE